MYPAAIFLSGFYLRQIGEQLRLGGVDVAQWLAGNGLDTEQLANPELQLDPACLQGLIRDAVRLSGEPALGLLLGARLAPNAHGMLGFAALHSASLRQAIAVLERFLPVRASLLGVHQRIVGDELRLVFEPIAPLGDVRQSVLEAIMLTSVKLIDAISGGQRKLKRVAFEVAALPYQDLAESLFGVPVQVGSDWSGFALSAADLDLPLDMADAAAFNAALQACQRELETRQPVAPHGARVRKILFEASGNFPDLPLTARLLCMTPRTLHRRLVEEGTSFTQLLDGVRHALACEQLRSGHLTLQDIADRLGYGDQANFRRAFKRWEGIPPSEFRRLAMQLQSGTGNLGAF